ncbi:integrin beta-PS, partial [Caerostris extrusa]
DDIGWRNKSRKLLVFSTDNAFHYAGDGRLGGIIVPNDEKCHLDDRGYYTMSDELDYPSLSQINRQIRDHKINMIFAVTKDQVSLYETLSKRLVGSSTGELENDSSNVVDLVRQQYDKITSAVEMTDDLDGTNIRLSYFSSCLRKQEQTNICRGLKVGQNVTFEVNLEYAFCPQEESERTKTFHIFPVGLQDQLTVHLEMMCECECENAIKEERFSPKCSDGNGTFECGICNCNAQRYGKECECAASDADPFSEVKGCFNGDDSRPCSGNGQCRCGRCYCDSRANPDEKTYGKYCECNNFSCDKKDGKTCNGKLICSTYIVGDYFD